ncbi:hypothetical protein FVE85_2470 [Porphyridium purpureum]|uniref:RWP-RK domain-containing protein n=1 Tax=Porphyridium purpureum TaxID=35688 RepID=A0A5J4YJY3_PORPP|nr:hypothetical protein FVE85_2470 [Porphyridium purpureum]|eukprot:POR0286..scf291_13
MLDFYAAVQQAHTAPSRHVAMTMECDDMQIDSGSGPCTDSRNSKDLWLFSARESQESGSRAKRSSGTGSAPDDLGLPPTSLGLHQFEPMSAQMLDVNSSRALLMSGRTIDFKGFEWNAEREWLSPSNGRPSSGSWIPSTNDLLSWRRICIDQSRNSGNWLDLAASELAASPTAFPNNATPQVAEKQLRQTQAQHSADESRSHYRKNSALRASRILDQMDGRAPSGELQDRVTTSPSSGVSEQRYRQQQPSARSSHVAAGAPSVQTTANPWGSEVLRQRVSTMHLDLTPDRDPAHTRIESNAAFPVGISPAWHRADDVKAASHFPQSREMAPVEAMAAVAPRLSAPFPAVSGPGMAVLPASAGLCGDRIKNKLARSSGTLSRETASSKANRRGGQSATMPSSDVVNVSVCVESVSEGLSRRPEFLLVSGVGAFSGTHVDIAAGLYSFTLTESDLKGKLDLYIMGDESFAFCPVHVVVSRHRRAGAVVREKLEGPWRFAEHGHVKSTVFLVCSLPLSEEGRIITAEGSALLSFEKESGGAGDMAIEVMDDDTESDSKHRCFDVAPASATRLGHMRMHASGATSSRDSGPGATRSCGMEARMMDAREDGDDEEDDDSESARARFELSEKDYLTPFDAEVYRTGYDNLRRVVEVYRPLRLREIFATISREEVMSLVVFPIPFVAQQVGLYSSSMKRVTSKFGVRYWPYRKIEGIRVKIARVLAEIQTGAPVKRPQERELWLERRHEKLRKLEQEYQCKLVEIGFSSLAHLSQAASCTAPPAPP